MIQKAAIAELSELTDLARRTLEPPNAVRIPPGDVGRRERFRLFADGIADGAAVENPRMRLATVNLAP